MLSALLSGCTLVLVCWQERVFHRDNVQLLNRTNAARLPGGFLEILPPFTSHIALNITQRLTRNAGNAIE